MQTSYEARSKALLKVSNVINNTNAPSVFLTDGGVNEANRILRDYHKQSVVEANKARDVESDVIAQLSGLRADLGSKIKEIKSLSGDFKNSVEKEKENTRKAVAHLEDALAAVDVDPSAVVGKGDPFVVRLAVDRQIERQIDEENYLHRVSAMPGILCPRFLTLCGRHTSISKAPVGNLSLLWWARSRRPTMHWPVS